VWLFNTKYRVLTKLVAKNESGLVVLGKSVREFSEENSIAKRLKKPKEMLKNFLSCGKVERRKFFDNLNTKFARITGQIGKDTIILKVC